MLNCSIFYSLVFYFKPCCTKGVLHQHPNPRLCDAIIDTKDTTNKQYCKLNRVNNTNTSNIVEFYLYFIYIQVIPNLPYIFRSKYKSIDVATMQGIRSVLIYLFASDTPKKNRIVVPSLVIIVHA